mgnify:CR=1 FL=1
MNTTATTSTKKVRVITLALGRWDMIGQSTRTADGERAPLKVGDILNVSYAEDGYIVLADRFTIDNEGDLVNYRYTTDFGNFEIVE